MKKKIVVIIVVALLGLGIWLGQRYYGRTDEDRAVVTLKEFLKIQEDRRQFGLGYAFLSSKKKEELKKYFVFNAEDYKEFRDAGGRILSSEILKAERIGENNINIVAKNTLDAEGSIYIGDVTYFMIKENNEWKIDDWERIPSTWKKISETTRWDERTKK